MAAQAVLTTWVVLIAGHDWKFSLLVLAHVVTFFVIRLELNRLIAWAVANVLVVVMGCVWLGLTWLESSAPLILSYLVFMYQFIFDAAVYAKGKGFFKRG